MLIVPVIGMMIFFTIYPAFFQTAIRLHMEANMLIKHKQQPLLERRPRPKFGSRGSPTEASQRHFDDSSEAISVRQESRIRWRPDRPMAATIGALDAGLGSEALPFFLSTQAIAIDIGMQGFDGQGE